MCSQPQEAHVVPTRPGSVSLEAHQVTRRAHIHPVGGTPSPLGTTMQSTRTARGQGGRGRAWGGSRRRCRPHRTLERPHPRNLLFRAAARLRTPCPPLWEGTAPLRLPRALASLPSACRQPAGVPKARRRADRFRETLLRAGDGSSARLTRGVHLPQRPPAFGVEGHPRRPLQLLRCLGGCGDKGGVSA